MSRKDRALLGCTQSVISVGELRKGALSRCRRATTHFARAHSVIAVFWEVEGHADRRGAQKQSSPGIENLCIREGVIAWPAER